MIGKDYKWYLVGLVWYCDAGGLLLAVVPGASYSVMTVDGENVIDCVDSGTVATLDEGMPCARDSLTSNVRRIKAWGACTRALIAFRRTGRRDHMSRIVDRLIPAPTLDADRRPLTFRWAGDQTPRGEWRLYRVWD